MRSSSGQWVELGVNPAGLKAATRFSIAILLV